MDQIQVLTGSGVDNLKPDIRTRCEVVARLFSRGLLGGFLLYGLFR